MSEIKSKWIEPEIIDLSVKDTESGSNYTSSPDGDPWRDGSGNWQEPHGRS